MPILLVRPAGAEELDELRKLALELVDKSRAEHGLPPLGFNKALNKAAQSHAHDMLKRNYYSHNSPEGKTVSDRFEAAGGSKWLLTAENIAKCEGCNPPANAQYVRQMHEGWMKSPGHRKNILRKGLQSFGYGMAVSEKGVLYAVQTFAGAGTPNLAEAGEDLQPVGEKEQAATALQQINEKRKAASKKPLELSNTLNQAASSLIPKPGEDDFEVRRSTDLYSTLPAASQQDWSSVTLLSAACGGCGAQPVAADIRYFTQQWLQHPDYAKMLLSGEITHLGFTLAANGKGKKVAVGLVGTKR